MNSLGLPLRGGLAPARLVLEVALVAGADVLAHQHLVAREVLEDHADALAQRALVPLLQIEPFEQDAPGGRRYSRVSSLISVVLPEPFSPTSARLQPGFRCRVTPSSAGSLAPGYVKPDVLEAHAVLGTAARASLARPAARPRSPDIRRASTDTDCPRTCRRSPRGSRSPRPAPAGTASDTSSSAPSVMRAAHRAHRDPRVRAVQRDGCDQPEPESPRVAPDRRARDPRGRAGGRCPGSDPGSAAPSP